MSQICHCDSKLNFEDCCQPYLEGAKFPLTAVDCMRSRYSAFVENNIDYITSTHHPDHLKNYSQEETQQWASQSDWLGLTILNSEDGLENDSEGQVEFEAKYKAQGKQFNHHELSHFKKVDGKWYFVDGQIINDPIKRSTPKIGRNEPCPCGSGKKFKKCCA